MLRNEVSATLLHINAEIQKIKESTAPGQNNAEKDLSIEYLEKAKAHLREAKHYIGLSESTEGAEERVCGGN